MCAASAGGRLKPSNFILCPGRPSFGGGNQQRWHLTLAILLLVQILIHPTHQNYIMLESARKDVAKSVKTLLVLLQSLRGQQVTIILRNDSIVSGTIIKVDADMNVELSHATIEIDSFYNTVDTNDGLNTSIGQQESHDTSGSLSEVDDDADQDCENQPDEKHDYLLIRGTRIRHIEIPTDFDLIDGARCELERIRNRRRQWSKRDMIPKIIKSDFGDTETEQSSKP